MTEIEVQMLTGVWRVLMHGEHVCIVDQLGRERHRSRGHESTATHLAMALADLPFSMTPHGDKVLRELAENFRREHGS
jgi:RecG-like helicase